MARTTLVGPPYNSMALNTGDAAERGMHPKELVDAINSMVSDLYTGILPKNTQTLAIGDSRIDNGRQVDAANVSFISRGVLAWAKFLTGQRFDHELADIYATTGFTTTQIISTWLPSAVASTAGLAVVLCSTNDRAAAMTAAQSIANLTTIRDQLIASGKVVLLIAETPRGGANVLAPPQIDHMMSVHQWILQQSTVRNVYVSDPWPVMADPASTTASDLSAYFSSDDLHPSGYGAYYGFAGLVSLLNYLYPPRNILPSSNSDVYSATNPRGVLSANPMTLGTTGTVTAPGAGTMSGNLADSFTAALNNGTGLTVVLSKVTIGGKEYQQAAITGTPTVASSGLTFTLPAVASANFSIGDVVDGFCEFQMDAAQTGMNRAYLQVFDSGAVGGSKNRRDMDRVTATDTMPTDALAGVMRVPKFTIGATETITPSFGLSFIQNVAVSATIRFRCLGIRKVVG